MELSALQFALSQIGRNKYNTLFMRFTISGAWRQHGSRDHWKHQGGKPLGAAVWAGPCAGLPTTLALPTLIRPGAGGIGIISDSFAGLTPKPMNYSVKWI